MKKTLFAFTAITTLLCGSAAWADRDFMTGINGRPENFDAGDSARYGVWHTKGEGFHLDVTTAGARHHFKGRIKLEDGKGYFTQVDPWKGVREGVAEVARGDWFAQRLTVTPKKHAREIDFDFVSESKTLSGVTFNVEGKANILWELCIGGPKEEDPVTCDTQMVRIGKDGQRAPAMPFETHADPDLGGNGD